MLKKIQLEVYIRNVVLYTIIGISKDCYKEFLGLRIYETESAKHWLSALKSIKSVDVDDFLIFTVGNLKENGISTATDAVFSWAEV